MRAAVRVIYSSDVDVASYVPEDPENAGVWVRLVIGPNDGPGEESFDVLVCTPLWLRGVVVKGGPRVGRHHLIVDPFDLREACDFLRRRVESVEGADWSSIAERLGRLGYWEFEDYSP